MLAVTGQARLLDRTPVLQHSIERRNPYVDPLSFIEVELLRRLRRDSVSAAAVPSGSNVRVASPWSANARNVAAGIVLITPGAISSST